MSKYKSIRESIFEVLVEQDKENSRIMTIKEIAEKALGPFKTLQQEKVSFRQVKQNMGHAIEFAAQRDIMIIAKKQPTLTNENRKHRVIGYKIAGNDDKKWVEEAIECKIQKVQDYTNSYNLFSQKLVENNLIEPSNDLLRLDK